jgi:glycyl-tRNA synthetase beta chain
MSARDFLVEIGTEELPPKSLFAMAEAFAQEIAKPLTAASLAHGAVEWFATPRRLAVRVRELAAQQPDQEIRRQGPAIAQAFDKSGAPTKAALGFAASCGVPFESLQRAQGPKGEVLLFVGKKQGEATVSLLPAVIQEALANIPIARRMRWGSGTQEFVRPVHWIVILFGEAIVDTEIFGIRSGNQTRGHRFHAPAPITIDRPSSYESVLREKGRVIVSPQERQQVIESGARSLANSLGGEAVISADLLEEVSALVEWPVPVAGRFDARFLDLPEEVPIATMQDHQRYFPVRDRNGKLMNHFITIANIQSQDPEKVRDGNERVIRPRLADAAFFWETDLKQKLETRCEQLKNVTFQAKLGSLFDKSERVAKIAERIAQSIVADSTLVRRAAQLSKCDLLSNMVGEFPELQGLMGKYYAQHDGEPAEVCRALEEQYLPRFAGDRLPETKVGIALSIADKLDTIAGIFAIGQKPTGTRDPFGLRRAALGVLRTALERSLDLNVLELVRFAVEVQPVPSSPEIVDEVWTYILERLRGTYLEDASRGVTTEMFDAVVGSGSGSPVDIERRLDALREFLQLPEAQSLASANKRIANILRKSASESGAEVAAARLAEPAEQELYARLQEVEQSVRPILERREYTAALRALAGMRDPVDRFFDSVMVMAEDASLRSNRLALLSRLRALFLEIVDLSRLPG